MSGHPVIAVVGATATGKSELGIRLAQKLDGEVINADAMQLYKGMDIGTGKVPSEDRHGIRHHLLDVLSVRDTASVSVYQKHARRIISDITARGKQPIVVGGSGLYVRAIFDDMNFPPTDATIRSRLEEEARESGIEVLYARLSRKDPDAAAKISAYDLRRIVRALEVIDITGNSFSAHLPQHQSVIPSTWIGLSCDRNALAERIHNRVHNMMDTGWVEEVKQLVEDGLCEGTTAPRALGYAQLLDYLSGKLTVHEAVEDTITRTRQFAKRQNTWFRRDSRITWYSSEEPTGKIIHRVLGATLHDHGSGVDC